MVKTKERQRLTTKTAANPTSPLPPTNAMDVFGSWSSAPGIDQPLPELHFLITRDKHDKLAFSRGLTTGLAISAMMWAAMAALIWQTLHP